jgi:hypothetical protein
LTVEPAVFEGVISTLSSPSSSPVLYFLLYFGFEQFQVVPVQFFVPDESQHLVVDYLR